MHIHVGLYYGCRYTCRMGNQHKVKQKMGECSWQGLMQSLGEFLKVTDQLTNQDESEDLRKTGKI